ncbi:MAG: hypothetical protein QHI38_11790, partial [Armatimonadota bacterium]|nr:hypothetical protein [Armatimonadota bacterium]
MDKYIAITIAILVCCALTPGCSAPSQTVSQAEAVNWVRYLVPLPKSIEFAGKLTLKTSEVAVQA